MLADFSILAWQAKTGLEKLVAPIILLILTNHSTKPCPMIIMLRIATSDVCQSTSLRGIVGISSTK